MNDFLDISFFRKNSQFLYLVMDKYGMLGSPRRGNFLEGQRGNNRHEFHRNFAEHEHAESTCLGRSQWNWKDPRNRSDNCNFPSEFPTDIHTN